MEVQLASSSEGSGNVAEIWIINRSWCRGNIFWTFHVLFDINLWEVLDSHHAIIEVEKNRATRRVVNIASVYFLDYRSKIVHVC